MKCSLFYLLPCESEREREREKVKKKEKRREERMNKREMEHHTHRKREIFCTEEKNQVKHSKTKISFHCSSAQQWTWACFSGEDCFSCFKRCIISFSLDITFYNEIVFLSLSTCICLHARQGKRLKYWRKMRRKMERREEKRNKATR